MGKICLLWKWVRTRRRLPMCVSLCGISMCLSVCVISMCVRVCVISVCV